MAEQSKIHRFEVGDTVAYTTDGHEELPMQTEGVVQSFENDEMTHLSVAFGEDEEVFVVTEDELRRLA